MQKNVQEMKRSDSILRARISEQEEVIRQKNSRYSRTIILPIKKSKFRHKIIYDQYLLTIHWVPSITSLAIIQKYLGQVSGDAYRQEEVLR